jgi:threonine aldolase
MSESDLALSFVSDNAAGAHPDVLAAVASANAGHCIAYGDDRYTEAALAGIRRHFGEGAQAWFVFNGTGANVVALRGFVDSHQAVLCGDSSHLWGDECGAPERLIGCKLIPVASHGGKIEASALEPFLRWRDSVHHSQPAAVSITQSTEWGTVYRPEEIRRLAEFAHEHELVLHMDGARLANAAASLGASLRELTTDAGVDVVSFGGTKNGLLFGEVVILTDARRGRAFAYHRKQAMQLASKMRFLAVQFEALLADDLWLRNADRANAMARLLAEGIARLDGLEVVEPVESNAVFVAFPEAGLETLVRRARFPVWDPERRIVRLMAAFDTEPHDVERFVSWLSDVLRG